MKTATQRNVIAGAILIGFAVLFSIAFGLASWIVTLPYVGAFAAVQWIERHVSHPALVFPSVVVLLFAGVWIVGIVARRQRARGESN